MKKLFLHIVFLFLLTLQLNAGTAVDSLFIQANDNYAGGYYMQAIELYESVLAKGMESGELYFNFGNAYYKLKNYPKSILQYERALLFDPRNEDIKHNLAKARMYIIDKIDEIPEFVIKRWINSLITLLSSNTWAILSLFTFVLGIVFLLFYFLSYKLMLRRAGFYSGIIVLLLSLTMFFLSFRAKSLFISSNEAIIMTPTVTVKSSPRASGTDLFIVHEGTKILIIDSLETWYEIRLSDGKQGWLQQKDVEPI